jgi:ubiquinone/menaquinone biosynthesis C-methylase UbiE
MDSRLTSEREFHNVAFATNARDQVNKFYSVTKQSKRHYAEAIKRQVSGKRVLEYGCGPGSYSFSLAALGAEVVGIDISDTAIEQANQAARNLNLNIGFQLMNAEKLTFPDKSFDLVCGSGILHHLDLKQAAQEISRILAPDGKAIFYEPLGHNIFINAYRHFTPHLRTPDEHPLVWSDFKVFHEFFADVNISFFNLTSLLAFPFRNFKSFDKILSWTACYIERCRF